MAKQYMIVEKSISYNDEYYYYEDGVNVPSNPKVYTDKTKAQAECDKMCMTVFRSGGEGYVDERLEILFPYDVIEIEVQLEEN